MKIKLYDEREEKIKRRILRMFRSLIKTREKYSSHDCTISDILIAGEGGFVKVIMWDITSKGVFSREVVFSVDLDKNEIEEMKKSFEEILRLYAM